MSKNLYITATEPQSGKSAVALGVMQLLLRDIRKVAFFRPIISERVDGGRDHDVNLLLTHFNLDIPYEDTFAYTLAEARELINNGESAVLMENILNKYKALEAKYDFVLCEGTDFRGKDAAFEFDLNASIAANLGCPALLIASGRDKSEEELLSTTQLTVDSMEEKGLDVFATVINRAEKNVDHAKIAENLKCKVNCSQPMAVYVIPEEEGLGNPTVKDVQKWLEAEVIYGADRLEAVVEDFVVAAMQIGNFLDYVENGSMVITPGDREDIILTALASRLSGSFADISGVLLTGGLKPSENVQRLIEGWSGAPLPILSVKGHTYQTTQKLAELYGRIDPEDLRKVSLALGTFESHVNSEELGKRLIDRKSSKVTPKMFEYNLVEKAKSHRMRIVLPEGECDRVLRAAEIILRRNVCELFILGDEASVKAKVSELGLDLSGAHFVDPKSSDKLDEYAQAYFEARKHKGILLEDARDRMLDATYFATMMVHKDDADGMVSGALNTTAHTIRPAFEFIKTKPTASIVSSVFLMCMKDRVHVYGDCAVNPNPKAEQLAEIAIGSAETARIFGVEPRVAMLSYSTGSSGKGADVDRVKEAVALAKEKAPQLALEGPLQFDAAIDPGVAATKLPGSEVAGKATVFIFPDLNTGNNTYKAVQRSSGAVAIGPVLQGLNKPVNDLSRGCTIPDIVNTVAITAIQAQAEKGLI
ncbi:phosphate acetyltransferase [Desulfobaculum bizertense]|uniref:Phosphate acetyltransferase n=1 Tax=Desulfobaculum bizertense DSM 18034 TaxID=1121442 RepID=A0A1T4VHV3_9BACT|nr:phosphate acetyltransferase [Desulfobaculum bizertense]UIJ37859.1 phosphate acetyltransferase [Desulfobaculum bizertense]SKA64468.1 phosphotransacetylase [Desulfobaculum bizertense DSM 18034]